MWSIDCAESCNEEVAYFSSSSPLLLKSAPDIARILFHTEAPQATGSEGLAQGPYVAAREGFKPATLRTKEVESTNAAPRPAAKLSISNSTELSV